MKLNTIILGLFATLAYASPMIQEHEPSDAEGQDQAAGVHPRPLPPHWPPHRPWPRPPWRPWLPKILESPVSPRQDDGEEDGDIDDGYPMEPFQDDGDEDGSWDPYF